MSNMESFEQVKKRDRQERESRARRLSFINKIFKNDRPISLPGKTVRTLNTIEEAKDCFIYGNCISTVILAQVVVEQMIRFYVFRDRKIKKRSRVWEDDKEEKKRNVFYYLLKEGNKFGLLTDLEYNEIEQLRNIRNPLVHFRDDPSNKYFIDIHITEDQAKFSIQTMAKVIDIIAERLNGNKY
jgi:hypothetical protein